MSRRLAYYIAVMVVALLLHSCSSSQRFSSNGRACPPSQDESSVTSKEKKTTKPLPLLGESLTSTQKRIVENAQDWLGVPYLWGGNTKRGVDCSGLVKNVYDEVGINLPRTAQTQYDYSEKIKDNQRRTGDLVFFSKGKKISHVGIYIGDGEIIHSASGKGVVRQSLSDSYLQSIYVGTGRVLP